MEVTEDEIIHDLQIANDVADASRAFNCALALALDDFGAGYSSLARWRQLPFSELKIDRSYVMNCHTDRVSAGLCEVIIQLGQRFGLKTVAEGLETTHECHKLQAAGCDIGQGYLFAKPMPKNQLIGRMRGRLMEGLRRPAARNPGGSHGPGSGPRSSRQELSPSPEPNRHPSKPATASARAPDSVSLMFGKVANGPQTGSMGTAADQKRHYAHLMVCQVAVRSPGWLPHL